MHSTPPRPENTGQEAYPRAHLVERRFLLTGDGLGGLLPDVAGQVTLSPEWTWPAVSHVPRGIWLAPPVWYCWQSYWLSEPGTEYGLFGLLK